MLSVETYGRVWNLRRFFVKRSGWMELGIPCDGLDTHEEEE